jgi:uncharacterized membrane protein
MTTKTVWSKVEAFLWPAASVFLFYVVYDVIVYRPKAESWPFWSIVLVLVVAGFWWTGFKSRLAKFLRESLRMMIAEELQESRIAFVTWLRQDAPWRGENPFIPPPEEQGP